MENDLTPKQEGFVKDYLETGNATEAAARNYDVANRDVARSIGAENLAKPSIRQRIEEAADTAFSTILSLSMAAENENVRLGASKDILDRAGFKPVEKQDVTSGGKPIPILNVLSNNSNKESSEPTEEN